MVRQVLEKLLHLDAWEMMILLLVGSWFVQWRIYWLIFPPTRILFQSHICSFIWRPSRIFLIQQMIILPLWKTPKLEMFHYLGQVF
uniref:Kinesin-like protein n=1 Tax=Rhizophora mucronata TaxID=61149 RepID=A0A2P2KCI8_RHIMU